MRITPESYRLNYLEHSGNSVYSLHFKRNLSPPPPLFLHLPYGMTLQAGKCKNKVKYFYQIALAAVSSGNKDIWATLVIQVCPALSSHIKKMSFFETWFHWIINHEFWYYTMCSGKGYVYICLILSFKNKKSALPYIHTGVIV